MNKIVSHQTCSVVDSWLLSQAQSLIAYAETNSSFAASLARNIRTHNWEAIPASLAGSTSRFLTPTSETEAVLKGNWLFHLLDTDPSARYTRGHLATWAGGYESPRDVLFGFVGLAIIGPTLGLIEKKKKKRAHLQVVISRKWEMEHSAKELATLVQNISMGVVADELRMAGGNAYNLHPDTADWCFSEPLTKIYLDYSAELLRMEHVAKTERLPHRTIQEDDNIVAVAISPMVNDEFVSEFAVEEVS